MATPAGMVTDCAMPFVAPEQLRRRIVGLIRAEVDVAGSGEGARIVMKMNALVDKEMIERLYEASQAGVEIDLIVRGQCCLRPGVPGLSERIRVRSIVGRYLEHSRINPQPQPITRRPQAQRRSRPPQR